MRTLSLDVLWEIILLSAEGVRLASGSGSSRICRTVWLPVSDWQVAIGGGCVRSGLIVESWGILPCISRASSSCALCTMLFHCAMRRSMTCTCDGLLSERELLTLGMLTRSRSDMCMDRAFIDLSRLRPPEDWSVLCMNRKLEREARQELLKPHRSAPIAYTYNDAHWYPCSKLLTKRVERKAHACFSLCILGCVCMHEREKSRRTAWE